MRISSATLLIGGACLALASPLRVIVIEKVTVPPSFVRIGHAGANANHDVNAAAGIPVMNIPGLSFPVPMTPEAEVDAQPPVRMGNEIQDSQTFTNLPICDDATTSISTALHRFGNYFREMVGLPVLTSARINCRPATSSLPQKDVMPCHSTDSQAPSEDRPFHIMPFPLMPGPVVNVKVSEPVTIPRPSRFRNPTQSLWLHRHGRPSTFFARIQKALYALSPWEGRALAFVVGCGIGVLLRMFYVFTVLAVRAICYKEERFVELEDDLEEEVLFEVPTVVDASPPVYNEKREFEQ